MDFPIANYQHPRERLRALTDNDCPVRVVFLEGAQHTGKTYLLESLKLEFTTKLVVVPLDKRRTIPTPLEILSEISFVLGSQHFQTFVRAARELQQRPVQAIASDLTVIGSYNRIEPVAQETEDDRLFHAIQFTRSFLDDLQKIPNELKPLVLAFDGYDSAMSLVDRWFDRALMPGLCQIDHVRLIVCGREVPENTVKWRAPVGRRLELVLMGVTDEREWMPIIAALKRRIPGEAVDAQTWYMRGVIAGCNGAPGLIMAHIAALKSDG
jgi:hypothetical protein